MLGPSDDGDVLETFWRWLETFWIMVGTSWEALDGFLGGLGGFQGPSGKHFLKIFWHLKQFMNILKNLEKTMVFH